jgi:hypothetical protein
MLVIHVSTIKAECFWEEHIFVKTFGLFMVASGVFTIIVLLSAGFIILTSHFQHSSLFLSGYHGLECGCTTESCLYMKLVFLYSKYVELTKEMLSDLVEIVESNLLCEEQCCCVV